MLDEAGGTGYKLGGPGTAAKDPFGFSGWHGTGTLVVPALVE